MTHRDALRRALAYFVVGATSTPLSAAVFDVAAWKLAAAAGVASVLDFARNVARTYLDSRGEAV